MLKFSYLDKEITSAETRQVFKSHLLQLFEEGADYYNQLLRDLGEIYCPDIDRFYDVLEPRDLDETGRYAYICRSIKSLLDVHMIKKKKTVSM